MKVTLTDEQIEKAAKAANAAACTSNPDVDVEEMWEVLPPDDQGEWRRATRAALEAVMPGEPVAWGAAYSGKIATISLTKTRHHTAPLYAHPAPEPGELERLREESERLRLETATEVRAFTQRLDGPGGLYLSEDAKHDLRDFLRAIALAEGGGDE